MGFSSIGNILDKNIKQKTGLAKQVTAALVCDEFDKIIIKVEVNRFKVEFSINKTRVFF